MILYYLKRRMNRLVLRYVRKHFCALKEDFWQKFNVPFSATATEPNHRVGRPRQEPGALRRRLPMDGTWAPVETGVTVTLSKLHVLKETWRGASCVPDVFDTLQSCDYSSLHPVSICAYGILIPCSLHCCAHFALPPLSLSLACSLSLTHPQCFACCLPNARRWLRVKE